MNIKLPLLNLESNHQELLKYIALVLMTIDHFVAIKYGWTHWAHIPTRIVLPIFGYIMVYNYVFRTSNKVKYISKLFAFAVISQIPYIYAFEKSHDVLNILFTLFLGLLFIYIREKINKAFHSASLNKQRIYKYCADGFLIALIYLIGFKLSYLWFGIVMIFAFYCYLIKPTYNRLAFLSFSLFMVSISFLNFWYCSTGLFMFFTTVYFTKKIRMKLKKINGLVFYAFYPLHLLILKFIF